MSDNSTSRASGNLIIGKRFSHHKLRRLHRNPRILFITSAGEAHLRTKPIDLHPVPIAPIGHVPQSEREHHICTLPWLENSCSLESLQNRCRIPRLRWELGIELWNCCCSCLELLVTATLTQATASLLSHAVFSGVPRVKSVKVKP